MNTEIIGLLENINVLYNRKNNINELLNLINENELQKVKNIDLISKNIKLSDYGRDIIPKREPVKIRVLSYNVSFHAMSGTKNDKSIKVECPKDNNNNTKCLVNVASFIKSKGPFDFIGLQEAANYQKIIELAEISNMTCIHNKPDARDMVTLYDPNKYKLEHEPINYYMNGKDRPFTILFFEGQLCVINMHPLDRNDFYKLDSYLKNLFVFNKDEFEMVKDKLKTYTIIMMGDMNTNFGNDTNILILRDVFMGGRMLHGKNKTGTCCSDKLMPSVGLSQVNVQNAFDHILTTRNKEYIKTYVYDTNKPASNHLPIIAEITL